MRRLIIVVGVILAALTMPSAAVACSPPFVQPTIAALGPNQIVVVGTIGERVDGGRLFHVERAFNGPSTTPIVIAFKEGEPVGDCSYPVHAGERLVIAPYMEDGGRLSADLGTLQAHPNTADGRRYLDEAIALFGPGVVPAGPAAPEPDVLPAIAIIAGFVALVAVAGLLMRERSTG
jgi:hypothetical protein